MAFDNALEPPRLVELFASHPPEGFERLDDGEGGAPAFAATLDLLTSVDRPVRQRLRAAPGHALWSRWLRWRTSFVGTTVSEYALLPPAADARALARRWRERFGPRHRLLIVKDLPQRSPLLESGENARAEALAEACREAGYLLLEGQALAFVPIDFADIDAYLARLSSARRKDLRRKLRSRQGLDIRRRETGPDAFASEAEVDAYYALYLSVHAQSELHFDRLSRSFLAGALRTPGGVVFEYRTREPEPGPSAGATATGVATAGGCLIGWNLCYEARGMLVDKYIGLAYPASREHDLYFVSWFVNLEHALARGLSHYVAGWTDPEVKAQLGARFTFTRHAVYVRNPLLRALLRRCLHWFEGDRQALEARA
jgi:predicted N-acyltransferase